jgi:hypothetical protein
MKIGLNKHHCPALTREVWQDDADQKILIIYIISNFYGRDIAIKKLAVPYLAVKI